MNPAAAVQRVLPALLALAISVPVGATAIFDASAVATLTIQEIGPDVTAEGDAFVFDHGSFTFGPAASATDSPGAWVLGSNPFGTGDGISQSGMVSGQAGPEEAFAFAQTDGVIVFENLSADEIVVQLMLDYALSAMVSSEFADEDAAAEASVILYSGDFLIDFEAAVSADTLFGPSSDSASSTASFGLLLAPGQRQTIVMLVDAAGFALSFHEAPEPSTLGLLALGGIFAERARRRRRQ
jgi:hypothetical protein